MTKFRPRNRHGAKLSPELIRQMYALRDGGATIKEVAHQFGTSIVHAGRILRGEQWPEVWMAYYGVEGKATEIVRPSPAKDALLDEVLGLPRLSDTFGDSDE